MISLATVLVSILALFGTRIWGLTLPYQRFQTEFLSKTKPVYFVRIANLEEGHRIQTLRPDAGFWLDVHQTSDGRLLVITDESVEKNLVQAAFAPDVWRGPVAPRYTLQELRIPFPTAPLLEEVFHEFPQQKMILNVVDNFQNVDEQVAALVNSQKVSDRVMIQSDAESVMKSVKEKNPLWTYGTSRGDLMRLLSFESIYLEPASPFFGDIFISPLTLHGRTLLNHNVIAEIHRRQKDVYLGPLVSKSEYDAARQENPDGFILAAPAIAESVFSTP